MKNGCKYLSIILIILGFFAVIPQQTLKAVNTYPAGSVVWEKSLNGIVYGIPVIVNDRVYFGTGTDNMFYCLDYLDGDRIWKMALLEAPLSPPLVIGDKIFVGGENGVLYCLDADNGDILWKKYFNGVIYSGLTYYDGSLVLATADGYLYLVDAATGDSEWRQRTFDKFINRPVVVNDKIFIAGAEEGNIYCFDIETGAQLWSEKASAAVEMTIGYDDENVYYGDIEGGLYARTQDFGNPVYTVQFEEGFYGSATLINDRLYIGGFKNFYCLDKMWGSIIWEGEEANNPFLTPVFIGDYCIAANLDGKAYIYYTPTGDFEWYYDTGYRITTSPIYYDGLLFLTTLEKKMIVVSVGNAGYAGNVDTGQEY